MGRAAAPRFLLLAVAFLATAGRAVAGSGKQDLCDALAAKFQAALRSAAGRCRVDRDCAVYPTFVDCGGFTDKQSAATLVRIHKQYVDSKCGYTRIRCAAQAPQVPFCDGGQCRGKRAPCFELVSSFNQVLGAASGRCKADKDCASYPSGVVDCGGVTDRATAKKLDEIGAAHLKQPCGRVRCAHRRPAVPVCQAGSCKAR
jgi:hypothetical protein